MNGSLLTQVIGLLKLMALCQHKLTMTLNLLTKFTNEDFFCLQLVPDLAYKRLYLVAPPHHPLPSWLGWLVSNNHLVQTSCKSIRL